PAGRSGMADGLRRWSFRYGPANRARGTQREMQPSLGGRIVRLECLIDARGYDLAILDENRTERASALGDIALRKFNCLLKKSLIPVHVNPPLRARLFR